MKKLAIIGAGGHGKVVADCAEQSGLYDEIFFIDDSYPARTHVLDFAIKATFSDWSKFLTEAQFVIAIGDNHTRLKLTNELLDEHATLANVIHPSAVVSQYATLGEGSVVFANAVINCATITGKATIINTGATVDHDCTLGDACHISPGANIAGGVTIGNLCWLGIGSSIIQGLSITDNTQFGAGAAVIKNITQSGTYVGVPAQKITKT